MTFDTLTEQKGAPGEELERAMLRELVQEQVRILVVDDDEGIRETLRLVLEEEGYHVDEAPDGEKALELLREASAPYVALLDIMMPHLGGVALLGIIAADRSLANKHAFLLITAGYSSEHEISGDLLTLLQVPVVRKPFDLDSLVATIEQAAARVAAYSTDLHHMNEPYEDNDSPIAHSN